MVAVPIFVAGMAAMRRHYLWVASRLRQAQPVAGDRPIAHRVVVLASRSGRHLDQALHFARLLHSTSAGRADIVRRVEAIVLISEVTAPTLRAVQYACSVCPNAAALSMWRSAGAARSGRGRLGAARGRSASRSSGEPLPRPHVHSGGVPGENGPARQAGTLLNVVIPEFVVTSPVGKLLHNQSALWIRAALYAQPRVAVTSVPWVLEDTPADSPAPARAPRRKGRIRNSLPRVRDPPGLPARPGDGPTVRG